MLITHKLLDQNSIIIGTSNILEKYSITDYKFNIGGYKIYKTRRK